MPFSTKYFLLYRKNSWYWPHLIFYVFVQDLLWFTLANLLRTITKKYTALHAYTPNASRKHICRSWRTSSSKSRWVLFTTPLALVAWIMMFLSYDVYPKDVFRLLIFILSRLWAMRKNLSNQTVNIIKEMLPNFEEKYRN